MHRWLSLLTVVVALGATRSELPKKGVNKLEGGPVLVCYVGTWAIYRPGNGKFEFESIEPNLCTHYMYAFAGVGADGSVQILDSWLDLPSGLNGFNRFVALKKKNPTAKFLISFGGWNQGSATFSSVARDAALRKKFAKNAADFAVKYGFDGCDIDWEYPGLRGGDAADKDNFVELLKELHAELSSRALLLAAAVSVGLDKIEAGYNVPELTKYLDLINLMAYDMRGSWESRTGMNAALRARPGEDDANSKHLNVLAAVQLWLDRGAAPKKLALGLPFYGRTFKLANPKDNGVGAAAVGAGNAGQFTREAGSIGYNEVCLLQDQGQFAAKWDEASAVPYASQGDQWVSYDNERSLTLKTELAKRLGLAGVMVWSLETDDFRGDCKSSGGAYPLLRAVYRALRGGGAGEVTTTPDPPQGGPETTTLAPTTTTQRGAADGGTCTAAGRYVRDASDCGAFYYCGAVGQPLSQYPFRCGDGLYFDEALQVCNWPAQVQCGARNNSKNVLQRTALEEIFNNLL